MKKYLQFIGVLMILLTAGYIFLVQTVMPKYIRQMLPQVESMAPAYINGSVAIGGLTWNGGLSAEITDVTIKDEAGSKVVELPRTIVHFRPWLALGTPARAVSRVELIRPQAYLAMDEQQQWNMQHLLKPSDSEETPFYGLLEINDGRLQITMPQGQWSFGINGTVSGGANPDFAVDVQIASGVDRLALTGLVDTKGQGRLQLAGDKLDLAAYAPLAEHYAGIKQVQGGLGKLALIYDNKNGGASFSGQVDFNSLRGLTSVGGEHCIQLDGGIKADENVVSAEALAATVDGQRLLLQGEADLRDLDNLQGKGLLTAQRLNYGGYTVTELSVSVQLDKQTVLLENVAADYGGGKIIASGSFDLQEMSLAADASLMGVEHSLSSSVQDKVRVSGQLAVLARMDDDKISLQAAADALDLQWRSLLINKLALDGAIDAEGLHINNFSAFAGDGGSLAAHGSVGSDGLLRLAGRMVEFPINPLLDAALGQDGSGLCSTGFTVGGSIDAPEFSGIVQLKNAEIMHQKIAEGHGLIGLKDNVLQIKDFAAQMDQGRHLVNGSIDLRQEEPYFDLSVETYGVRIEPLMQAVAPGVPVTGNVDNLLTLRGTVNHPFVYGEVHASDGSAAKRLFNSIDGRYTYEDGRLQLHNFIINALMGSVKLDGVMSADRQLDFFMEASNVDLSHLPVTDETVALEGRLNAEGRLGGTLASPYFKGDVASSSIFINGEELTDLQGTLESNAKNKNTFKVSFKQPYQDNPVDYGIYGADLNIDLLQQFIQGSMVMVWGDIGGLLRMARQDYEISGIMQGELDFNPQGKGSGINIAVAADNVKIHERNYARMDFNGSLKQGVLAFDNVKLQEQQDVNDKGIITASGTIDLLGRKLDLELASVKANPVIATAVMKDPPEIQGEMDMLAKLGGTFDNPHGTASLTIADCSVAGVGMDMLTAELSLQEDNIKLEQLLATKDIYGFKVHGDIPLDIFRAKDERRNPRAEMNILMDLNEARLGILPAMTEMVEWGVGDTKGEIRLAGTLEEPLLFGSVKIEGGNIKAKYLDTVLENINLDVDFQGNQVLLRELSAKVGKGSVTADGSYALHTDAEAAYRLHINAENAELASQIFTGRINSDVEIVPQRYRDYSSYHGQTPPEQYRPLIKGRLRLDDVVVNMPTIPEMGEGESNLGMDLAIELGPKIHMYNSYLYDIWLKGGIHIKGSTLYPVVDGRIEAEKGTVKYLRTDFKLDKASLLWIEPGTFLPNVNLESAARFSRYHIFMNVTGPVMEMDLQLSSDPPLERNTIVRMLTLQREEGGSNEVTSEDMANLMTAGLQMTVLGDVEMWVKQTLGFDQFRVYTGKVRSGVGFESAKDRDYELTDDERNQYNILVSKYLSDKFLLGYTTSFDGIDRSVFGQYDISKHCNITYSRSYDMSDEAEEWYGMEYKISF